jgi:hypothetical protein
VIVAVTFMNVMQMTFNEIAGVIAVRNSFVPASSAMLVSSIMSGTGVTSAATIEVVLVYVIVVLMVKMTIMQVIYVVTVLNCGMSAGA